MIFLNFIKKRTVFCVATLFAIISIFFVPPSSNYVSYIDWNTLAILFALMTTVSGLEKCGVFKNLGEFLCSKVNSIRSLSLVLIFLCFVSSMLITNDVALLTFVPFAILILGDKLSINKLIFVVVLQTIAANLGSMLTPIGNPQNLFIFNKTGMNVVDFMKILLPYTIISGVLLFVSGFFTFRNQNCIINEENCGDEKQKSKHPAQAKRGSRFDFCFSAGAVFFINIYTILFVLCVLSVLKIIPKPILALIVFVVVLIVDRKVLKKVDYFLLLTFVSFFIFSGNLAAIPEIKNFLESSVKGNEFIVSLLASQVISNVPSTLMLYNFCDDIKSLLLGVDFGGLGTLVASLASLISFNIFVEKKGNGGRFLFVFTVMNIAFLGVLILEMILL